MSDVGDARSGRVRECWVVASDVVWGFVCVLLVGPNLLVDDHLYRVSLRCGVCRPGIPL
jgi:hypothetical protein